MKFITAILAGGSGERFWPWSRQDHPKQFLKLDGQISLLQATWQRMSDVCPPEQRLIVTQAQQENLVRQHLPDLTHQQLLLEPCARDTAAAVLLTTLQIHKYHGDAVVGIFPSDHSITDHAAFTDAVQVAVATAKEGGIVTFGIQPTHAATGYGYIEVAQTKQSQASYPVQRFVEKPNQARAEAMLAAGCYLWNAGMFFFTTTTMLNLFKQHAPDLYAKLAAAFDTPELPEVYAKLPKISLDYAIIEHTSDIQVIPVCFGWDDLGDWAALKRLSHHDNISVGKHISLETHRSIIVNQSKELVVTLGLEDVVVVHCNDVTLVMPKDRAQDVKQVLHELRQHPQYAGLI